MKTIIHIISINALVITLAINATAINKTDQTDPAEIRYVKNIKHLVHPEKQYQLSLQDFWQHFTSQHGKWYVEFNEITGLPHRAAGMGIPVTGNSPQDMALSFISNHLSDFGIVVEDLILQNTASNKKYDIVNFYQQYKGLKVLNSNVTFRISKNDLLPMFGIDLFKNIDINTSPSFSPQQIESYAVSGINNNIESVEVNPKLMILPIENGSRYDYYLVYVATVLTSGGIPAKYYTLVDAHTGDVLYRQNQVHTTFPEGMPATPSALTLHLESTITDNPYQSTVVRGLPEARVSINSNTVYTDTNGDVGTSDNPPVPANYYMRGKWAIVYTGATGTNMAQFSGTLSSSANTVSFDNNSSERERSAYYHTNKIHEHMKSLTPGGFTALDNPMTVRVDRTDGTCNAFNSGTSINFYAEGGGCLASARFNDVVYHEYGHSINYLLYNYYGGTFGNGALGEGYSDVWAYTLTQNPIMAQGFQTDPNSYIRRYDINPKVYPKDLMGEVHADGEIIAGAWWDTYANLNDWTMMKDIWMGTWPATLSQPDGNEGVLYRDILIEALTYDDDNANLFDGTPHGTEICAGFGLHGITLVSGASLDVTKVPAANANATITINAHLNITSTTYLGDVRLYWTINNSQNFTEVIMTDLGGNDYSADIPAQAEGTIVHYYLGVTDNVCNGLASVSPAGADLSPANIAYNTLVGYNLMDTEDFDFNMFNGSWQTSANDDDATTGQWDINIPVGSYLTYPDTNTLVQTSYQHTPNGQICALTGNAGSPQDGIGTNDVDGGKTTLLSPVLNLAQYTNPAITYFRWWTNETGANPVTDWLHIELSGDGGSSWTYIENTLVADRSWRRYAFRVEDYMTPTSTMQLRFVASDSIRPNTPYEGGSLIEAAIDDVQIWEQSGSSIDELNNEMVINAFPNPAKDKITLSLSLKQSDKLDIEIRDNLGRIVYNISGRTFAAGMSKFDIPVDQLDAGVYNLSVQSEDSVARTEISIIR